MSNDIRKKIEENQKKTRDALEELAQKLKEEFARAERNEKKEQALWLKFLDIVKDKEYFRIEHVDALNVPYNILLFLSNKNTGKTTEIYRNMSKWIDEGHKFIYMRASKGELDTSSAHFLADSASPCIIVKNKSTYFIYSKKDHETIQNLEKPKGLILGTAPNIRTFNKYGIPPVGMAIDFKNCQSIAGGQFEGYKYIIMDECLTYDPKDVINQHHFANWAAFPSSVARNKPDLKIYMFGNLRDKNIGLLDFYSINVTDQLRYIERGEPNNLCRILFINACDLYGSNFKTQTGAVQHVSIEYSTMLENNLKLLKTSTIIDAETFRDMQPYAYLAFSLGEEKDYLIIAKKWAGYKFRCYAIQIKPLQPYDLYDMPILTTSRGLANRFENVNHRQILMASLFTLFRQYDKNKLLYADQNTLEIFTKYFDRDGYNILHKPWANALSSIGIKI